MANWPTVSRCSYLSLGFFFRLARPLWKLRCIYVGGYDLKKKSSGDSKDIQSVNKANRRVVSADGRQITLYEGSNAPRSIVIFISRPAGHFVLYFFFCPFLKESPGSASKGTKKLCRIMIFLMNVHFREARIGVATVVNRTMWSGSVVYNFFIVR